MKFVHIVDNWDVENWEKYNSFLETQEIILSANTVEWWVKEDDGNG